MAAQWLTADEQRAWRAYLRAGTLLTARLNRQLQADSGLSLPEYEVLVRLSEAPDGQLRPFQLGLALDWEQSRLSHLLTRMTRRGFVARQDCAGDRRGAEVVLTGPGRAAIESAAPGHVAAVRRLVFDQMDSAQAAAFRQVFEAILSALEDDGRPLPRAAAIRVVGTEPRPPGTEVRGAACRPVGQPAARTPDRHRRLAGLALVADGLPAIGGAGR
jgi:DNA-binding MarR family transcriptional regulator